MEKLHMSFLRRLFGKKEEIANPVPEITEAVSNLSLKELFYFSDLIACIFADHFPFKSF
jgi:hypothetical protein